MRNPFNLLLRLIEKVNNCLRIIILRIIYFLSIHLNKLRLVSQCLHLNLLQILLSFFSIQYLLLLHLLLYLIIISTILNNTLNFRIILFHIFTSNRLLIHFFNNQNPIFTSKQMSPLALKITRNNIVTLHQIQI